MEIVLVSTVNYFELQWDLLPCPQVWEHVFFLQNLLNMTVIHRRELYLFPFAYNSKHLPSKRCSQGLWGFPEWLVMWVSRLKQKGQSTEHWTDRSLHKLFQSHNRLLPMFCCFSTSCSGLEPHSKLLRRVQQLSETDLRVAWLWVNGQA